MIKVIVKFPLEWSFLINLGYTYRSSTVIEIMFNSNFVGDLGVGKTSVLLRYLRNQFSPLYIPTKKVAIGKFDLNTSLKFVCTFSLYRNKFNFKIQHSVFYFHWCTVIAIQSTLVISTSLGPYKKCRDVRNVDINVNNGMLTNSVCV